MNPTLNDWLFKTAHGIAAQEKRTTGDLGRFKRFLSDTFPKWIGRVNTEIEQIAFNEMKRMEKQEIRNGLEPTAKKHF